MATVLGYKIERDARGCGEHRGEGEQQIAGSPLGLLASKYVMAVALQHVQCYDLVLSLQEVMKCDSTAVVCGYVR